MNLPRGSKGTFGGGAGVESKNLGRSSTMKASVRKGIAAGLTILVAAGLTAAAAAPLRAATISESPQIAASQSLSSVIDSHITAAWQAAGVVPAAPASDAEFMRRVYLDLIGVIPPVGLVARVLRGPELEQAGRAGRSAVGQPPLRAAFFASAAVAFDSRGHQGQSNSLLVAAVRSLAAAAGRAERRLRRVGAGADFGVGQGPDAAEHLPADRLRPRPARWSSSS